MWLRDMQAKAVAGVLRQRKYRIASAIAKLYSYMPPVDGAIQKYTALVGLERKPPAIKTLDEILSEPAEGEKEPGNGEQS